MQIGYVTSEVAVLKDDIALPTYSGGLGVLAGAYARAALHVGTNLVVFSILPKHGYYQQVALANERRMDVRCVAHRYTDEIIDRGTVQISVAGSPIHVRIWQLNPSFHMAPTYLLDTDSCEENDALSKVNTHFLYGGWHGVGRNSDRMIVQTMVLGLGAYAAAKKLGLNIELWHGNDSHAAFAFVSLLKEEIENGKSIREAIAATRMRTVYTTHTAVPAGNWRFSFADVCRLLADPTIDEAILNQIASDEAGLFNYAVCCLRLAGKINTVSKKHKGVSSRLWDWLDGTIAPIECVTNGSDPIFWQPAEFRYANTIDTVTAEKREGNRALVNLVRERTGKSWAADTFTVVWARRFAAYKRPDLLLRTDATRDWFLQHLQGGQMQFIISGKPHPDDYQMVDAWNRLFGLSLELPYLAVLPEYDMLLSRALKCGAHGWLNTPNGDEASGTSGMSGAMVGARNISTPDGWMCEAQHYVRIGDGNGNDRGDAQDLVLALLAMQDEFYNNPEAWYSHVLDGKREAEVNFCGERMARQYAELYGL